MTYTAGGLIQASDYNGFVNDSANNINKVWSTGSTDYGYGQTAIPTVTANVSVVTATQWATLVNNIANIASHTGATITSRTAPVVGNTITILNNVSTDINTISGTIRGNAVASGTTYGTFSGTTSKTSSTGSASSSWTITFTHTVTFASANAARAFFNAGGLIKLMYGKSSTGTDHDPDWNDFAGKCGNIFFSGRVGGVAHSIAGTTYDGTNRFSGTGGTQTTLATTTGFFNLTNGAGATTIFQLNNDVSPYGNEYIRTTVALGTSSTVLTFTTTWFDDGATPVIDSTISGGTGVSSPATSIGSATAPTTLLNYIPPSTTYLTAGWGTPTIAASVS